MIGHDLTLLLDSIKSTLLSLNSSTSTLKNKKGQLTPDQKTTLDTHLML